MESRRLLVLVLYLLVIIGLPNPVFGNPIEMGQYSKIGIQGTVNDLTETVLERFFEAGQLIWIQLKQFIDPKDIGFGTALQKRWTAFQENPLVMGSVGLAMVGIPILIFRSFLKRKLHREELQKLKNDIENQTGNDEEGGHYDYDEEFRKIHGSEEIKQEMTEDNPKDHIEEKITSKKELLKEAIDEPTEIDSVETDVKPIEHSQQITFEKASPDTNEKIAVFSEQESEQQSSVIDSEPQETDSFIARSSQKQENSENSALIEETEDLIAPLDETFLDNDSVDEHESTVKEYSPSTSFDDNEMDNALSSLQEEMEQTIQEISEELVENGEILSKISNDSSQNPAIEETYQEKTKIIETFSSTFSDKSNDQDSESPSVKEILKLAEGETQDSEESETPNIELDLVENVLKETKPVEAKDETADTPIQMTEKLLEDTDVSNPETASLDETENAFKNETSETEILTETDAAELEKPESTQPLEPKVPPIEEKVIPQYQVSMPFRRTKNYVNRLEQFQKQLEDRIRSLGNDPPVLKPIDRSLDFRKQLPQRKAALQSFSENSNSWSYKDNEKITKKAYSLDTLESFLFLEGQKR